MKRLRVEVTPDVEFQIAERVLQIAVDSIDRAFAWDRRLWQAIEKLADMPGCAIDEHASQRLGQVVRRYVFERNYLLHFTVDEGRGVVDVINFRHTARLPRPGEP